MQTSALPTHTHTPQGRTLLQLARAFYTDPAAHRLVYKFNHAPEQFSFDELLAELGHKAKAAGAGAPPAGPAEQQQ
jgi:hypothetical protein